MIPVILVTNFLLFCFCPLKEPKNKNQFTGKLVVWSLFQKHVDFNRLL